jgi:cytochrome c-type biogenesis protein CcmH/NrfG
MLTAEAVVPSETLMRFAAPAVALSLMLLAASSGGIGQKPDDQIVPRSLAFQKQGEAALAGGDQAGANDALEAAVVADPRNRAAFVALGRVAQAQGLPGKAVRYYKNALQLDPNDPGAIGGEGEALVQRGAVDRAKANLAKLQTLCKAPCPQVASLSAAIAKGPPPVVQTAQAGNDKVPPKGQETTAAPKN